MCCMGIGVAIYVIANLFVLCVKHDIYLPLYHLCDVKILRKYCYLPLPLQYVSKINNDKEILPLDYLPPPLQYVSKIDNDKKYCH